MSDNITTVDVRELQNEVAKLKARVRILEEKIATLEQGPGDRTPGREIETRGGVYSNGSRALPDKEKSLLDPKK